MHARLSAERRLGRDGRARGVGLPSIAANATREEAATTSTTVTTVSEVERTARRSHPSVAG